MVDLVLYWTIYNTGDRIKAIENANNTRRNLTALFGLESNATWQLLCIEYTDHLIGALRIYDDDLKALYKIRYC